MDEESQWPTDRLNVVAVRRWIASVLPNGWTVEGPTQLFGSKGWGVTARFETRSPDETQSVIFKSCPLPQFRPGPLFSLLSCCCPDRVPELLAWREEEGRTDALFCPFVGRTVTKVGTLEALLEMVRSLSHIQVAVAASPAEARAGISRLPLDQIPALLDSLIHDIQRRYEALWETEDRAMV